MGGTGNREERPLHGGRGGGGLREGGFSGHRSLEKKKKGEEFVRKKKRKEKSRTNEKLQPKNLKGDGNNSGENYVGRFS